jgi:hypothetical protein
MFSEMAKQTATSSHLQTSLFPSSYTVSVSLQVLKGITKAKEMRISPWLAVKARNILRGPFHVYPFMSHQNYAFHLGIGTSDVPVQVVEPIDDVCIDQPGDDACSESIHVSVE